MVLLGVIATLLCAYLLCHIRLTYRKPEPEDTIDGLVQETAFTVYDFLEAGNVASVLTEGKYGGTISVRFHERNRRQLGCTVYMYDSGALAQVFAQYRRDHRERVTREQEVFEPFVRFLNAYGNCYDPERDALVYSTKATIPSRSREEAEAVLLEKLRGHPLAEVDSVNHIRTKR